MTLEALIVFLVPDACAGGLALDTCGTSDPAVATTANATDTRRTVRVLIRFVMEVIP